MGGLAGTTTYLITADGDNTFTATAGTWTPGSAGSPGSWSATATTVDLADIAALEAVYASGDIGVDYYDPAPSGPGDNVYTLADASTVTGLSAGTYAFIEKLDGSGSVTGYEAYEAVLITYSSPAEYVALPFTKVEITGTSEVQGLTGGLGHAGAPENIVTTTSAVGGLAGTTRSSMA